MKKLLLTIALVVVPFFTTTNIFANDLTGNIGISLYGGAAIPTNGDYTIDDPATDILDIGPQFGLGVTYFFTAGLGVELMGNYGFNSYNEDYQMGGLEPTMSNLSISLNGVYNFGHLLGNSMISPIARAGVGVYNWSHLDDGLGGEVIQVGNEDFSGSSFGFNIGLGCDINLMENLSLGLIVDYNMYFPTDEDKFGKDYAEQGYLTPQLKVSYYIPTN